MAAWGSGFCEFWVIEERSWLRWLGCWVLLVCLVCFVLVFLFVAFLLACGVGASKQKNKRETETQNSKLTQQGGEGGRVVASRLQPHQQFPREFHAQDNKNEINSKTRRKNKNPIGK